jgi:flagellar motility protein MotE (MotC chaperone)
MQMRIAHSFAVLALLLSVMSQGAMGGGPSDRTSDAGNPTGQVGASDPSEFTAALPTTAAQLATTTEEIVLHLGQLTHDEAAAFVDEMEVTQAADVLVEMDNETAVAIMGKVDSEKGSLIMAEMTVELAVWMMGAMDIDKVSDVWSRVEKVRAGEILEQVPLETAVQVVGTVSEERLVPRLPEMGPEKLWEFPVELLID